MVGRGKVGALLLLGSQGASSLGNMALMALIARQSSVHAFAAFALVFPIYIVTQRFIRTYIFIPRQIDLNRPSTQRISEAPPLNETITLSIAVSVPLVIVAQLLPPEFRAWASILGASLPGLHLYDCIRNEYLSLNRFGRILVYDVGWLVSQLLLAASVIGFNGAAEWQLVAWVLPTYCVSIIFWVLKQRNVRPSARSGFAGLWRLRNTFSDSITALLQTFLSAQVLPYVVAAIASFQAVAALRAGQTLLGPANVAVLALVPLVQMEVARAANNRSRIMRAVNRSTMWLALLCIIYSSILLVIPESIGTQLFGSTWKYATVMLLPLGFHLVGRSPFSVVTGALRAMDRRRPLVRVRVVSSMLLLVGAGAGSLAYRNSIAWVAWGMFAAGLVSSIALYLIWRVQLAKVSPGSPSTCTPEGRGDPIRRDPQNFETSRNEKE